MRLKRKILLNANRALVNKNIVLTLLVFSLIVLSAACVPANSPTQEIERIAVTFPVVTVIFTPTPVEDVPTRAIATPDPVEAYIRSQSATALWEEERKKKHLEADVYCRGLKGAGFENSPYDNELECFEEVIGCKAQWNYEFKGFPEYRYRYLDCAPRS